MHWYPKFHAGGGVANAVLGLAEAEAHLGADVAIAAMNYSGGMIDAPMEIRPDVTLMLWKPRLPFRWLRAVLPAMAAHATEFLQDFRPDLVHIHGELNPDNLPPPRVFSCPLVLSPHGGFHPNVFRRGSASIKWSYFFWAKRHLYRHVHLHAVSPLERDYVSELLPGIPIYCVHQGPGIQSAHLRAARKKNPGDAPTFIFVGRLNVGEKGLDLLVEAFARALAARSKMTLALVGPDYNGGLAWLKRRCQALGISDRVSFLGSRTGAEVGGLLADADVYIQLSRLEGFGLSVAEALLAGLPAVLSSAVGAASYDEIRTLPHVRVVEGEVAAAADAIAQFAERHAELRASAVEYAAQIAEFLSWRRAASLHLEHYGDMIAAAASLPRPTAVPAVAETAIARE